MVDLRPDDPQFQFMQKQAFRALLAAVMRRPPRVVFVFLGVLLAGGVVRGTADRWLGPHGSEKIVLAAAHIPELVRQGEWWRLVTATLLHANPLHLLLNIVGLFVLGRPIEAAWGPARFALLTAGAALGGSLVALPQDGLVSVGASGALFGLLAALAILGVRLWSRLTRGLQLSMAVAPTVLLIAMLTTGAAIQHGSGRVDLHAHLGGAFVGAALALVLRPQLLLGDLRPAQARRERAVTSLAIGVGLLVLLAVSQAAVHVGEPMPMPTVHKTSFAFAGQQIALPAGLSRGVWRDRSCVGQGVDGAWALSSGRTPCVQLPLGSVLLIDRRERQLTMDAGDWSALRTAARTGRFVWRQESVMVHPLDNGLMYLLFAAEPLLRSQALALQSLLPPPGTIRVEAVPLPATASTTHGNE
jgi:membrane associated rhomboid family serine protease